MLAKLQNYFPNLSNQLSRTDLFCRLSQLLQSPLDLQAFCSGQAPRLQAFRSRTNVCSMLGGVSAQSVLRSSVPPSTTTPPSSVRTTPSSLHSSDSQELCGRGDSPSSHPLQRSVGLHSSGLLRPVCPVTGYAGGGSKLPPSPFLGSSNRPASWPPSGLRLAAVLKEP